MSEAESYTYNLPDDYELKPETREKLDKLVHRLGLSNEDAQEFVDIHVELMEEYANNLESEKKVDYTPEDEKVEDED